MCTLCSYKTSKLVFAHHFSFNRPSKWQKDNCSLPNSAQLLFPFGKIVYLLVTRDLGRLNIYFVFLFVSNLYNYFYLFIRLNAAGDLITLPLQSPQRRSILVTGCVSYDFPRTIHHVAGSLNIDQYTTVLESVAAPGRTIVHSRSPVHSSPRVKEWILVHNMSSILWPIGSADIMPMTSIWRQ
jgi:hypothetical protein